MDKQLQINTLEERRLWNLMKKEIQNHNSYNVRKKYYPFMLDLWEIKLKNIENDFRTQIQKENQKTYIRKMETDKIERKDFLQRKIEKQDFFEKKSTIHNEIKEKKIIEELHNSSIIRKSERIKNKVNEK